MKSIEYDNFFSTLSQSSNAMAAVMNGRIGDMIRTMESDEARLYYVSQLVTLVDPSLVGVHKEQTAESFQEGDMWYFRYELGYTYVGERFDALLNVTVEAETDIEVCLRGSLATSPKGWAPHSPQETVQLYTGKTFRINIVPIAELPLYCFEIKSTAPFSVKYQGYGSRKRLVKPLVLTVNDKPSLTLLQGTQFYTIQLKKYVDEH